MATVVSLFDESTIRTAVSCRFDQYNNTILRKHYQGMITPREQQGKDCPVLQHYIVSRDLENSDVGTLVAATTVAARTAAATAPTMSAVAAMAAAVASSTMSAAVAAAAAIATVEVAATAAAAKVVAAKQHQQQQQ